MSETKRKVFVESIEITEMLEKMSTLDMPEYLWSGNMLNRIHTSVKNSPADGGLF